MYDTSENEKIISFLSLIFRVCGDCDVLPQPNPAGEGVTPLDHLHDPIQHRGNAGVQAGETGNKKVIEKVITFCVESTQPRRPAPPPEADHPQDGVPGPEGGGDPEERPSRVPLAGVARALGVREEGAHLAGGDGTGRVRAARPGGAVDYLRSQSGYT